MINKKLGNLLSVTEGYIIHGCNAQGVMGAGLASQIKNKYYPAYLTYKDAYDNFISSIGKMPIGTNSYFHAPDYSNVVVVNAVTQEFYGNDSFETYTSYAAMKECFRKLNLFIINGMLEGVPMKVNFPMIGCGLGGGIWNIVAGIINKELDDSIEKTLWVMK